MLVVLGRVVAAVSRRSRQWRKELFIKLLSPRPGETILDLGGGSGDYIASIVEDRSVVTIADNDENALHQAREKYGFKTVILDGSPKLSFPDKSFDIVFCSSVIEHVTGPKDVVFRMTCGKDFRRLATQNQSIFASEIDRVSKRYFVQTPYKFFPIESHSALPIFLFLLPRRLQIWMLAFFAKVWFIDTTPDFHLLGTAELAELFPNCRVLRERFLGFTKSIIAVGHATAD
jgi:SAM-dependent methyltransferase